MTATSVRELANAPPIPFSWQTAIWKQHRLSASIIDCSDFRFAFLNSSLENNVQHLYDYRAVPYLVVQIYIEELLGSIGRAKNSDYRIDPPPTVTEKFNHHINLKRQCLAYIPFLCWLIDFDILIDTAFACEPCLRSCLLHNAAILQATLIYAYQELTLLNQHLHFDLCFHHPHPPPPPPHPPMPKPPTPKPPTSKSTTHPPRYLHPPQLEKKWLFSLSILACLARLLIRHYIHSSLESTRNTISACITEAKKAVIAALILVTAFMQA
ncbi:hypothetical protein E4T44_02022 [Aureobasidium sp. EXF-8845]|nr:hypothetical protein E4T44_02022 [Aureobasidium sp. EXF-8845]KAI4856535.1 hypothetical protein E4T45_02002 [Aureobasidium sp. EXF-8846]